MYFIFKGIKSTDMGVTVLTQPPIKSPESRTWDTFIDNKDGADSTFMGFKPMELSMEIAVEGKENLDKVLGWLDGEGQLIRSDFPDRYRNVHINNGIELNMINPELWTGAVTYLVADPFWYKVGDEWSKVREGSIYNGWSKFVPHGTEGKETKAPVEVFDEGYGRNHIKDSEEVKPYSAREIVGTQSDPNYLKGKYLTLMCTVSTINVEHGTGNERAGLEFNLDMDNGQRVYVGVWAIFQGKGKVSSGTQTLARTTYIPDNNIAVVRNLYAYHQVEAESIAISNVKLEIHDSPIYGEGYHDPVEWVPAWEDLPDSDKPVRAWDNMYVHMSPLGNGLTRIRTRGGNNIIKLRSSISMDTRIEKKQTRGLYLENNSDGPVRFDQSGGIFKGDPGVEWEAGEKGYKEYTGELVVNVESPNYYIRTMLKASSVDSNLDLLVVDPTIVDGDPTDAGRVSSKNIREVIFTRKYAHVKKGTGSFTANLDYPVNTGTLVTTQSAIINKENSKVLHLYNGKLDRYRYDDLEGNMSKISTNYEVEDGEGIDRVFIYKSNTYANSVDLDGKFLDTVIEHEYTQYYPAAGGIVNEGNVYSTPIMKLTKVDKNTNEVTVSINGNNIIYNFPKDEDVVYINFNGMRAGIEPFHTGYGRHDARDNYLEVEQDFSKYRLEPGYNKIDIRGEIEVSFLYKDRWI